MMAQLVESKPAYRISLNTLFFQKWFLNDSSTNEPIQHKGCSFRKRKTFFNLVYSVIDFNIDRNFNIVMIKLGNVLYRRKIQIFYVHVNFWNAWKWIIIA